MSYRDDVAALAHRCRALEADMSASRVELEAARRLLDEAKRRRQLPVLENLHVAAPCSADWNRMTGDARARFCGQCEKNVYNLSDMTRAEAEALLVEKEGKLCVRYYQRADGTILTADCPSGVAKRRRKRRVIAVTFAGATVVAAAMSTVLIMGAPMASAPVVRAPVLVPVQKDAVAPGPHMMTDTVTMGQVRLPSTRPKK